MAFTPSSPSSPSSPGGPPGASGPAFPRPRFSRGPLPTPNKDEHRINERIRVPQVRLIDENGGQVGIVDTREALQMARERGLDLMEISPTAQPPVCKIADYGKFKYEKKKKEAQARKKQTVIKVKEVQLRPQTDVHDLEYKTRNIRTFLEEGDKAKISIMFRGREIVYADQGYKMMRDLADQVKDIAAVESPAKLEGKKMIMVLAPAVGGAKAKVSVGPIVKPLISSTGVSLPVPNASASPVAPKIEPVLPKVEPVAAVSPVPVPNSENDSGSG